MWIHVSFVLSQSTRLSDGQTDRWLSHGYTARAITRSRTVSPRSLTQCTMSAVDLYWIGLCSLLCLSWIAHFVTLGWLFFPRDLKDRRETVTYVQRAVCKRDSRDHEMGLLRQSDDNYGPFVFLAVKTASRVPHTHTDGRHVVLKYGYHGISWRWPSTWFGGSAPAAATADRCSVYFLMQFTVLRPVLSTNRRTRVNFSACS